MSQALERYRELENRLRRVRLDNDNQETPEEDRILDQMDDVWYSLTPDEQDMLCKEGPNW